MDFVIKFHSRHGFSEGCTSIPGVANPLRYGHEHRSYLCLLASRDCALQLEQLEHVTLFVGNGTTT
jgi:hypothetical protein